MILLAIESSSNVAAVALAIDGEVVATECVDGGRRHVEALAPMIDEVCRRAGSPITGVDVIAVDVGPGLFTGLRAGVATATTLGWLTGAAMVAVPALDVLAEAAARMHAGAIVAVSDARRGEVFHAAYLCDDGGDLRRIEGAAVSAPAGLAGHLVSLAARHGEALLVGDGAERYADLLCVNGVARFAEDLPLVPPVELVARAGVTAAEAGLTVAPEAVEPLYLRGPDTRINWKVRDGARPPGAAGP